MSRGATAGLFVAVDQPAEVSEQLAAWARGAAAGLGLRAGRGGRRPLRLLVPDTLHLTLCFLGSRPGAEIETLASALDACALQPGELRVGAPVWLPPRRPRALAVEIHENDGAELATLHAEVSRALTTACDWQPERRRFRAHVTLARVAAGAAVRSRQVEPELPPTPPL